MSEKIDLYHPLILQHNRDPQCFYKMEDADMVLEAYNPVCGDKFTIYIKWAQEKIREISFYGYGCAVSKASTSVLMTQLINRSRAEVRELTTSFFDMFEDEGSEQKPDLTPFMVVKKYPSRMSCVTLSWKSIKENL